MAQFTAEQQFSGDGVSPTLTVNVVAPTAGASTYLDLVVCEILWDAAAGFFTTVLAFGASATTIARSICNLPTSPAASGSNQIVIPFPRPILMTGTLPFLNLQLGGLGGPTPVTVFAFAFVTGHVV